MSVGPFLTSLYFRKDKCFGFFIDLFVLIPHNLFLLLFLDDAFAKSSWESRLVLSVLEDDRVFHPSHHDRVKAPEVESASVENAKTL
jgi:hypothetical protein